MVSATLLVATVSGALLSPLLSGCGGAEAGSDDSSTSTSTTTTTTLSTSSTTTTTTTTVSICEPTNHTGDELIDSLNDRYLDFNTSIKHSSNGVYIRMHDNFNIHCGGKCFGSGQSTCALGAALYNHQVMTQNATEGKRNLAVALNGISGIVFDTKFVESKIGKCYYQYNAGTYSRKNRGCGHISWHDNCTHADSPWANQWCDWSDDSRSEWADGSCRNLTAEDDDTNEMLCDTLDTDVWIWPKPVATNDTQCAWKGPAFYFNKDTENTTIPSKDNQAREMLKQRLKSQADVTEHEPEDKAAHWNEVILDAQALLDWIPQVGINNIVSAFVYVKGNPTGHNYAKDMSAAAQKQYGGDPIPVLSLDQEVDVRCNGPFSPAEADAMNV